jgi:gliding-associated putative ABC transporter substrate-binding component GldG
MKKKQTQALGQMFLVLAILIVVNFISVRIFGRLDLTSQNVYTLSDASKKLVNHLDDRLTIKAYFTEELPSPYNNNRRTTLDLLNEYKAFAGANLHFEFINPSGEKGEEEARQQGIPPVEVQVVKEDKFEVKRAYMGLVLMYEDRKEVLPVIQNLSSLEYDMSGAIKRLVVRTKKKIGFTTGHQETPIFQLRAAQLVRGQYDPMMIDLAKNEPIGPDVAALVVLAPNAPFNDSAAYQIDQYIMRGGKVAFLLNKVRADLQSQQRMGQELQLGLEDMLASYGIRLNADLIRDVQCTNINVVQQQGAFQMQSAVPYVYLPIVSTFSQNNVIVKDLQSVLFYFVSSVDTSGATARGIKTEVLARSSKRSGRQTGFFLLDPFMKYGQESFNESGIPLAAVAEGSFSSYFNGKPLVPQIAKSPDTRIIVVGDGDFMRDELAGSRGNMTFFANIIDYLADDAGLITIRSKNIVEPPLEQVTDGVKQSIKAINLVLPSLLVIGYGIFRWRKRVNFKRAMESQGMS